MADRIGTRHPGRLVAEIIHASGRNQVVWARQLGVSQKHLSQIVQGRCGFSVDFALRMERLSGVDAGVLMRLQADHLVAQAREWSDG